MIIWIPERDFVGCPIADSTIDHPKHPEHIRCLRLEGKFDLFWYREFPGIVENDRKSAHVRPYLGNIPNSALVGPFPSSKSVSVPTERYRSIIEGDMMIFVIPISKRGYCKGKETFENEDQTAYHGDGSH